MSGTIVSGLYKEEVAAGNELRLDVDGPFPQNVASGVQDGVTWVARVTFEGRWAGEIAYNSDPSSLLHRTVIVTIVGNENPPKAKLIFRGAGLPEDPHHFRRVSTFFRNVEFEYDVVEGAAAIEEVDTHAHGSRPTDLVQETLRIETVFQRAGIDAVVSGERSVVPLALAKDDQVWSDTELHDAMQHHWSNVNKLKPGWKLWVLFARQHQDPLLAGSMFDSTLSPQRQGAAVFSETTAFPAPSDGGDSHAWKRRISFFSACHEIGHAFNLAHSDEKLKGTRWSDKFVANEAAAFSFMTDLKSVGPNAFFNQFKYRFSDQELLFMRHAPEQMVQMGGVTFGTDHALRGSEDTPAPAFHVEIRANRPRAEFEFLEPCTLEVKLTNISKRLQDVPDRVLSGGAEHMSVIIKKQGRAARRWRPFVRQCYDERTVPLAAGASLYDSLFVGAGQNGWDLAEPGLYTVQLALQIADRDYLSNPLQLKVRPPRSFDEEHFAQDFFVEDVGRVFAFDGSRVLDKANDVLREAAHVLRDRAAAIHALVALGQPLMQNGKVMDVSAERRSQQSTAKAIVVKRAKPDVGQKELHAALLRKAMAAAQTLGHVDYKNYADSFSDALEACGELKAAAEVQEKLHEVLTARQVAQSVLAAVDNKLAGYKALLAEKSSNSLGRKERKGKGPVSRKRTSGKPPSKGRKVKKSARKRKR